MFKHASGKTIETIMGHFFYAKLLNNNSIIIDLGANKGGFSSEISQIFKCQCYAVEPSPSLFFKINENNFVHKFNNAITNYNGTVRFFISKNSQASSINKLHSLRSGIAEEIPIEAVTFETFLQRIGVTFVDLLKVDIEGAEFEFFNSTSDEILKRINQIAIEFHDFIEGIYDHDDVKKIKKRLNSFNTFAKLR